VREEVAAYFLSGFSMPGLDLSKAFKDPKQALGLAIQYHATQADRLRFPPSEFAGGSAQPPQAAPNVNAGLGDTANAERFPAGKVRIQSPQGNFLYIPEERLQSAFRAGYKLAPERQSPKASIGKGLHAPAADEVRTADAARSTKTGSNVTRLGIKRRNPADWRATRDLWDKAGYGGVLSDANRVAIARGRTPVVDGPWIRYFPEDAGLLGERIPMHHIGGSPITVPLPATRHLDGHMPGGFRYNSGGPGSTLPAYPVGGPKRRK
jgi:HNH/Endo VII superfamily nuclease toxin with a HHH motif